MLTEDTARNIGIHTYFPNVRRVFVEILRALDTHYGRPLMMTCTQNMNKVCFLICTILYYFDYLKLYSLKTSSIFSLNYYFA